MTPDLTEWQDAALREIIAAPALWVETTGLLHAGALPSLVALGLAAAWERDRHGRPLDGGPFATLTPLGAARLGVVAIEHAEECPSWGLPGHEPPYVVLPPEHRMRRLRFPERIAAKPEGPEYVMDEETAEPVMILGARVLLDRRMGRKAAAGAKGKSRARARRTA